MRAKTPSQLVIGGDRDVLGQAPPAAVCSHRRRLAAGRLWRRGKRPPSRPHEPNDTAFGIAQRFNITVEELASANEMTVEEIAALSVGQKLIIPQAAPEQQQPVTTTTPSTGGAAAAP